MPLLANGNAAPLCAFVVVAGSLILWRTVGGIRRGRGIRALALRAGLREVGDHLPWSFSFSLASSSLNEAHSIRNVIAVEKGAKRVLVFDCTLGEGRGSYSQTVFAVSGAPESFGAERLSPGLLVEQVDDWKLLYRPRELMSVDEIEAFVGLGQ
jgi:hypothetical protein